MWLVALWTVKGNKNDGSGQESSFILFTGLLDNIQKSYFKVVNNCRASAPRSIQNRKHISLHVIELSFLFSLNVFSYY